jgi:hypothetical protein
MSHSPYADEEYCGPTGPREALPVEELLRISKVTGCNMVTVMPSKDRQLRAHLMDIALGMVSERVLRGDLSTVCNKIDVEAHNYIWPGDRHLQIALQGMVHRLVEYLKDQVMVSFLSSLVHSAYDSVERLVEITGLTECVWNYHADGLMEQVKEELHSLISRLHKHWLDEQAQEIADEEEE